MKIILKYILNNVKERILRTAVMVLSIILSTTLLFVSLAIGDSYESAQLKMAKGFAGPAVISVSAKPDAAGNMTWISEKDIPEISAIKKKVGFLTTPALYQNDSFFENFDVIATNLEELDEINKPKLLDDATLTDFTGYNIIVTEKFTARYGLKIGDKIALNMTGKDYEFVIKAIAAYDTVFLRKSRGFNALIPKETLAEILNASDGNSQIMIVPADGVSSKQLKLDLISNMKGEGFSITKVYDEAQVTSEAQQKSLPFYLISFFSLVMSVFIIFSSYKVITMERLPIIGTFRSIGATEKSTTKLLLLESLIYGMMGGLVGIPLGYAVLKLILEGLGESLSLGIEIPMIVKPLNIALSCAVAVLVSLLSAYIPIRKASRLPIKEVVLGTVEEKNTLGKVKLTFGVILFILSILLPQLIDKEQSKLLMAVGGFSLLGLIVATIIVIPLITNTLSFILEHAYMKLLGNEGKLAARNMRDNKNIHQNVTLLFISLSSVIAICVVSSFAISYLGDAYGGGTLDGFASGDMSQEFVSEVKGFEGVEELIAIYELNQKITVNNELIGQMEGVDDLDALCSLLNVKFENEKAKQAILDTFHMGRNILLNKNYQRQRGINIGDVISLSYSGIAYDYKVLGTFQSRGDNSEAIIPSEYARGDFGSVNFGRLAYSAADPDAIIAQIRNLFGSKFNWSRTVEEYSKDAVKIISSFMEPMKKLTYFILLLAGVGIINNLLINYLQKRHSMAMYKSIGLSNRQNVKMSIIEGFTSGLIGTAMGMFVSYMEVRTIFIVAGPKISVMPEYDLGIFIKVGLAGIGITLIGSIVPILKSFKMELVEEIKFE